MNKRALSRVGLLVLFLLTLRTGVLAQCDNWNDPNWGYQYPTTVAAPAIGITATIAADNWPGEMSQVSGITSGYQYTFTMSGAGYVTVRTGAEDGTVVAHGASPLTVTAPSAGNLYIHWNTDAACGTAVSDNRLTQVTTVGPSGACTGTPTPGNTLSSVVNACPGVNFTLSLQNATTGSGVSYQWQVSTVSATGPWTNVGTSSPTYSATQTQASWYQCEVTCAGNGTGTSTAVAVGQNAPSACYCTTVNFTSSIEPICLVQFANINNSSPSAVGSGGALEDYTSIVGNINAGQTYSITLSGNTDGAFTTFFTVFFDFDQNGVFEASFPIGSITNTDCIAQVSGNISIPVLAPGGTSRMRVVKNFNTSPTNPCGTYGFGQAEDYTVSVTPAAVCTAQPAPGNTVASSTGVCVGSTVNLSLQNTPSELGISYQWQSSTVGSSGPWTNVGTDAPTYSDAPTVATWYQCEVTCAGNGTGTSTPVAVGINDFYACYCSANLQAFATPCITNVTFGAQLNNSTSGAGCALPAYTNYFNAGPSTTGDFEQGQSYNFSFTSDANVILSVWIDFDRDGSFEATEHFQPTVDGSSATIPIVIPVSAQTGLTGLRVRARASFNTNGPGDACTTGFGSGEAEDYVINITPAPGCTSQPAPGNTIASAASVCAGSTVNLSLQNPPTESGITYQWQSSTVGSGGPWTNVGTNAPTYSDAPTQTTWYQCEVTCTIAPPGVTSTPVQVSIAAPVTSLDFESTTFPPGCWTATANLLRNTTAGGYGLSTASAQWNFFSIGDGVEVSLSSPTLPAFPANYQVRFDVAGATYTGGEIDHIFLETSTSGTAGPWSQVADMTNAVGGVLNTLGATTTASFVPTSAQWNTLTYAIATGTNAIRFRGVSNFGNNVFIDNISFEEIPSCVAPSFGSLSASVATTTTANISWAAEATAVSYDVEVRQGGAPGSGGEVFATNTAATSTVANGLTFGQNYDVYVRSQCGANGTSTWTGPRTLAMNYCAGSAVVGVNDPVVANFTFAGINNNNASNLGYLDFTSLIGSLAPGGSYPLSVTRTTNFTNDTLMIWVDWNHDIDFNDPGEAVFGSILTPANPTTGNITVPAGALSGNTRLRLRRANQTVGFAYNQACGTAPFGQVQDYTINVCAPAAATASITDNCGSNEFSVNVNVSSLGSGASATVNYSINGVPQTGVSATVGVPVVLGPFASTATIGVSVDNGTACNLNLGDWYSNCPITIVCPTDYPLNHCYRQGDTRTFTFIPSEPGESVTVSFSQGTIATGDVITAYEGLDNSGLILGTNAGATDLAGLIFQSAGTPMHIEISQSTSADNCFAGTPGFLPWVFNAECTPGCQTTPVTVTGPTVNCVPGTGNGTYSFDLNIGATEGDVPNNVVVTVGGVPQAPVSMNPNTSQSFGPYPLGTTVSAVVQHANDAICNVNVGPFNPANTCPPANDECAGATVLPIQPPGGCGTTNGTTVNALYSTTLPAPTCGTTGTSPVLRDVWFTFNTGTTQAPIHVLFTPGTATGLSLQFYTGTCGALTAAGCLAAGNAILATPPANTTYWIRVISNSTTGTPGTFGLCVTGSQVCQGLPNAAFTTSNITPLSARVNFTVTATTGLGNYIVEYGPAATFTTPGSAGTPGPGGTIVNTSVTTGTAGFADLTCLNPSTQYRYFIRKNCGGGNYSLNWLFSNSTGTLFTTQAAYPASTSITHATCAQGAAIPDNGCGTPANTLNRTFAVTTAGTNMGVDVQLESIDIIATHTWRSDMNIRLQSPTGCVRNLILARGGSGDNFGNSTTCPASPLKLKDGGAALSTMSTTTLNVAGTFAPEEPLSGFTGNPNGNWTIRICDGASGDTGVLQYIKLNFVTCVGPTATRTIVPACPSGFNLSVNVTSMGSATGYTITNNINASTVAVTGVGTYSVGPFANGSNVILTLVHNADISCNATLPAATFLCPPANDDCANAIAITPGATCVPVAGTTAGATQSIAAVLCAGFTGNADDDVWYSFVATRTTHRITVNAAFDAVVDLRSGACTGTSIACADANFSTGNEIINATGLTIGATYYVRLYAYATGPVATPTFTICVEAPDCLGVYGGPAIPGSVCTDGNANTAIDYYNSQCVCAGVACTADLSIAFTKDATSNVGWTLFQQGTNLIAQTGTLVVGASTQDVPTCVPDGCYYLRVTDDLGDGIGGGYVLSVTSSGLRIIDNANNFTSGSVSQIASNQGFCIPMGTDRLIYTSCDKLDWIPTQYVYANDNPAVTAVWNNFAAGSTERANSGYEMWWYNPNGGYSFRRFQSHATTNGLTANATRACGFRPNSWTGNQLQNGVLYNVRVRSRLYNVPVSEAQWGPACRFILDPTRAQCPLTQLLDTPGNQYLSCGATRAIGTSQTNLVHARIATRIINGVSTNANRYQFRFTTDGGGSVITKTSNTGQYFVNTSGLQPCKTYDVEVRASFDNGATYCNTFAASNPYAPLWGYVCQLYTSGCASGNGGNQNMATEGTTGIRMFPNPNRGDQLTVSIDMIEEGVNTVSVDIYDVFGKRVDTRTIATQGSFVNTVLDLNGSLAAGMYTVNITAGSAAYTERLVIQP